MMNKTRADAAAALFYTAVEQTGGVKQECLALIAAAATGQHLLHDIVPEAKVNDMLSVLPVAGAVLLDDECGGLLDLVTPKGSA